MNTHETHCNIIQQAIAIGQELTQEQAAHVSGCLDCGALQREYAQLDQLVEQAMTQAVPDGFAERVLARLPTPPRHAGDNLFDERLPGLFAHSRLARLVWLGLGIAIGVSHIIRFFFGVFIAGMAAAS